MFFNAYKMIYLGTLSLTVVITFMTNNWLICWLMMEINLMMFVPMISDKDYLMDNPQSIKYFLIQVMGSLFLLMFILLTNLKQLSAWQMNMNWLLPISLSVKSGIPPFHFWFPQIMEMCNYIQVLILLTLQKIIPLVLFLFCKSEIIFLIIILSGLIGAISGFNQNSVKKILAYSSMVHSAWMLVALQIKASTFMFYLTIYCGMTACIVPLIHSMSVSYVSKICYDQQSPLSSLSMAMGFLSIAGMPPLLGFLNKMIVLIESPYSLMVMILLVVSSLISLIYYTRCVILSMTKSTFSSKLVMSAQKKGPTQMFNWLVIVFNVFMPSFIFMLL